MGLILPPDLERKILATPGVVVGKPMGDPQESASGIILTDKPAKESPMVIPVVSLCKGVLTAAIPVKTHSLTNLRDWKTRNRGTQVARQAVSRTLGPHLDLLAVFAKAYHAGEALRIVFTRLGGRTMDRSNLPTASKAVEDALAMMLGADDGDPRWRSSWEQDTEKPVGVLISMEIIE